MSQEKVYLRVLNGQTLYPLSMANIIASGEPLELYKEVFFAPKPEVSQFQQLKETLTVYADGFGRVDYTVEEMSLNFFLGKLQPRNIETGEVQVAAYANIPPDIAAWVSKKIVEETQKRLDLFAQTRHYDSIHTATSYVNSTRPQRASEGKRAVEVMDTVWDAVYALQAGIQAGVTPVPRSFDVIEAELAPILVW